MYKKGFVFIETLLLITILSICVLNVYSNYISVVTNISERVNYDRIGDLYKVDILRSNFINNTFDIGSNYLGIDSNNCCTYMNSNCSDLINSLNVNKIFISNKLDDLKNDNSIPNSLKLYLKTVSDDDESHKYIIVNFKIDGNNYYSSLRFR